MTATDGGSDGAGALPLDDLRVVEIGYGVAAPVTCRNLAEFGAEVVKVESVRRPDSLRTVGSGWVPLDTPWEIRRDTGIALNFTCPQKSSLGLEIDGKDGRAAFLRLIERSDVLVMNLAVEAVEHLGLSYEELRKVNPSVISMNMSAFGARDGPYRNYRTWGTNLSALAGLTELIGWPDRDPVGMPISFPDYVSALWGTVAVLCAVLRRDETGSGCDIDLSQFQVAIGCIGPTVLEAAMSGRAPRAAGNRAAGRSTQGVYPTREEGRWVAVSVPDDASWAALCRVDGLDGLAGDPRFAVPGARRRHHDELDELIGAWTGRRTAWEAATELQAAGVAASPVMDDWEVLADPQLAARGFFHVLSSTRFGGELSYGQAMVLSDTPPRFDRAAPAFGEHTRHVLQNVCGYDEDEVEALIGSGTAHAMERPHLRFERPFLHWIPNVMRLPWPPAELDPGTILFERLTAENRDGPGD